MNGNLLVLDSNFILDYLKGYPAHVAFMRENISQGFCASVITEMDLFSFPSITDFEIEALNSFMQFIVVAPLDNHIKNIAISFRRQTRRKLPDSIIAATAIAFESTLMTNESTLMTKDQGLLKAVFPGFTACAV